MVDGKLKDSQEYYRYKEIAYRNEALMLDSKHVHNQLQTLSM